MAYEPFSQSTRRARSTLLLFSVASVSVAIFDITLVNVPGVGFELEAAQNFLPTLVGFGTGYALITFLLYVSDDLKFIAPPDEMLETRKIIDKKRTDLIRYKDLSNSVLNNFRHSNTEYNDDQFKRTCADILRFIDYPPDYLNQKRCNKLKKKMNIISRGDDANAVLLSNMVKELTDFYEKEFKSRYLPLNTKLRVYFYDTGFPAGFGFISLIVLMFPGLVQSGA